MNYQRFAFALVGLLAAGTASAQLKTWNFGDVTAPGSCPAGGSTTTSLASSIGNVLTCSTVAPVSTVSTLEVRAFSSTATNSSGSTVTSSSSAGTHYENAAVNYHGTGSGIGVANQWEGASVTGSPSHAMDNSTPGVDLLLLNFTGGLTKQVLETVTMGWRYGDSDFQVLRWTGAGAVTSIAGIKATDLISTGWELVKTVAATEQSSQTGSTSTDKTYTVAEINPLGLSSSSWIISAYNSAFGAASPSGFTIDAMKVLGITASDAPTTVSTPGTLVLAGLGLLGATMLRRRRA